MTSVLTLLARDLLAWLHQQPDGAPRHVVLWLDPNREFARLVPHLAPALTAHDARLLSLAPDEGTGQLALKLALLAAPARDTVVYLPGHDTDALQPRLDGALPGLWALYEYRYTGCVWGRGAKWEPGAVPKPLRLYEWLRQHALTFAEDQHGRISRELTEGGGESLLSRYAERHRDTPPRAWPQPLRPDDVRADLAGDPRLVLRAFFAAPAHAYREWPDPRLTLTRLRDEFGFTLPDLPPADPAAAPGAGVLAGTLADALADTLALQLALTEAWDAFACPVDFPYRQHLAPRAEQRARQAAFLRDDLMTHAALAPLFRERMQRLEPAYPLADWAAGRAGAPVALPGLARARWQTALASFNRAAKAGLAAARDWLSAHQATIAVATATASGSADAAGDTRWADLADLATLCEHAQAAVTMLAGHLTLPEFVRLYTEQWWRVDATHLRLRARCAGRAELEHLRRTADLALFDYVSAAADVFTNLVEATGTWPLTVSPSVTTLPLLLWRLDPAARRAVIISDAFRWDLAQRARERLASPSRTVALDPVIATLPSITPFGMTALLPLDQLPASEAGLAVSYDGKPVLKNHAGHILSSREGRKTLLEALMPGTTGKPAVAFADMDDVLAGGAIPPAPLLVVFDNDIDQQGHVGGDHFPQLALNLAEHVARTVELLHAAGIAEVHVVTDHGFLLLPPDEVNALGRPQVRASQVFRREARWAALKPDAPVRDLVRLTCPLDPNGPSLGFPRGIRTLQAAEPYTHGGISPHECILPHLVSHRVAESRPLDLDLRVTSDQLTTGTVPVVVAPITHGASLWSDARPITIQVWVEIAGGPHIGRQISEPITIEVRPDAGELRPALYLREDASIALPAGQPLRLCAVERDTGRELAAIPLILRIPWE